VTEAVFGREQRTRSPAERRFRPESSARPSQEVVARQAAGQALDLASDGEQSKISYATYVKDRLTGFDGDSRATRPRTSRTTPAS
jgi:5-methyltetrahydropteroyltriglutamate--homocysteine methyltransferase